MRRVMQTMAGLALMWASAANAATVLFDFNSDPTAGGLATLYGSGVWQPSDGAGFATNANDGYLEITPALNSQSGAIIFSDFDNGAIVGGFHFEADVRIGNGTATPADGFCIAYVRSTDPALSNPTGGYANGAAEEGTTTGVSVGFDAYQNDATDPVALDLRVDGNLVLTYGMPTLNGSATDPTSIQTGPQDGTSSPDTLGWAHLVVDLTTNGVLNVYYKGTQILTNYNTGYLPGPGRLLVAGRTGGLNENQHIDNIAIRTVTIQATAGPITPWPDGARFTIADSGPSVVDPTSIKLQFNNGPQVTPTSAQKSGALTSVTYSGYPTLLPPGSTNQLTITFKDTGGATITDVRTFVEPNYVVFPPADAVASGVNTAAPGFRVKPWQSSIEPNRVYWANEQLVGLHGANNADLTTATDGGYIDFNGLINFNIAAGTGDAGNFQTAGGYPDAAFPGIPGGNGLTGDSAEEILAFVRFPSAGVYHMGVNSDDGFAVTEGPNPEDRLAPVLGEFDGGRGSSDTLFDFVVPSAGIYPVRLIWFNGDGELPGNGANLEWFLTLNDGTKILLNDPSSTNTTGVTAFYSGPALPAYVSQLNPYPGATGTRADTLLIQITDSGTTLTAGSVKLKVNGTSVTPTVTKSGSVTSIAGADSGHPLTPGTNTVSLVWSDSGGATRSNNWSFTVAPFVTLNASYRAPVSAADLSQPGFMLRVTQVDPCLPNAMDPAVPSDCGDGTVNDVDSANAMIAGLYFPAYGTNAANFADPNLQAASGNLWYWSNAVDFNIVTSAGDFPLDYLMPGIPTIDGVASHPNNSVSAAFDAYVVFPTAGYYVMGVSSDDNFRLSEGIGVTRQILHVTGTNVSRDIAAVPSQPSNAGGVWEAPLPVVPLTAPIVYVDASECPGPTTMNLTGKIALIDANRCGADGADGNYNQLVAMCQARGAVAVIVQASPGWGTPEVMTGGTTPITIPALHINGYNGDKDWFHTNGPLVATIGADTHLLLGQANPSGGKGMSHVDFGLAVPQPGLYPLHLIYEQGGGGAGLEWTTVLPDVTFDTTNRHLVNDLTDSASVTAYRALSTPPVFVSFTRANGTLTISWLGNGILQESPGLNPSQWTDVSPAPSGDTYTVPLTGPAKFYRLRQ